MAASIGSADLNFEEITIFRRNPSTYLSSKNIDEEAFVHSVLQRLCADNVAVSTKIHLLNCLQDYASTILTSLTRAEEVVASILDIFHQTSDKEGPSVLRGQVLVSITSITIQFDFHEKRVELFSKVVETLLEVACHTGTASDAHIRTIACSCLQELETCLPCMLQTKLEYIYQLAQMEKGVATQAYHLLLITTLRHAIGHLRLHPPASLLSNTLATLLNDRTEPLKPYILPKVTSDCRLLQQVDKAAVLSNVDLSELRRLVAFIIDYLPLLTPTAQVNIIINLTFTIKGIPEISTSMFKWVVMRSIRSYDIGFISILLAIHASSHNYRDTFAASLIDISDTSLLFRSIVTAVVHPGLPASHRLLQMEWLAQLTQADEEPGWPSLLSHTSLTRIFPRTFDGCDLQLKKLHLCSRLLSNYVPDDEVEDLLCSCLQLLQTSVQSGLGGRYATVLFRSIYLFYKHLPNRDLVSSIKWIIIRLGQGHGRLALRVLDFVEASQKLQSHSDLGKDVLLSLLTSISEMHVDLCSVTQIHQYLIILSRIAREPEIPPQEVVRFMQSLVCLESICTDGDWETGSLVLSVCRNLMANHNVNDIFVGLGHVVYYLTIQHKDIDIRDRGAFYYTLLCSLAPHKLTSLLSLSSTSSGDSQGLAAMMSRNNTLSSLRPLTRLQHPLLAIFRIPEDIKPYRSEEPDTPSDLDSIETYKKFIQEHSELKQIQVHLRLQFNADSTEDIDEIFTVELHFEISPFYKPIPDVRMPWVSRAENSVDDSCHFDVLLQPLSAEPIKLCPEALFCTRDGQTWRSPVAGVHITLEDLWRPLPVSKDCREKLYKLLWSSLKKSSSEGCLETIISLNINSSKLAELFSGRWHHLTVDVDDVMSDIISTYTPTTLLTTSSADDATLSVRHMAMFMAPEHHILLEMLPCGDRTSVFIVSDHQQTLPLLTVYLRGFETTNGQ